MSKKRKVSSTGSKKYQNKKTATFTSVSKPAEKKYKDIVPLFPEVNKYFDSYGLYILLSLLAIISFVVFKDFILLNKVYLYKDIGSDSINANYPHGYQVAYLMQHDNFIPRWSFYQGMGQNIFPFSIPDPFYFVMMLFGADNLVYGIAYMEIAKVFTAGIFFFLFLQKVKVTGIAPVMGGLLYAFSGFIILGSCWNIFSTQAAYLALLLYAFEKLYQDNKFFLLPIAFFLIATNQPLDVYLMGLFLLAYIFYRWLNEKPFELKPLSVLLMKVGALGVLGVLMSAFFLFGNVIQMLESPRVGGDSSYFSRLIKAPVFGFEGKQHNVTALMRFFSNDMIGTGSNFKGWYNYLEAPLFYFGLINFLLIPQLFGSLNKRKKIVHLIFILLFLLPVVFPFFRYLFWLFSGDYYRLFSLFVITSLLICSMSALNFIASAGRINFVTLIPTVIGLLIILFYNYFPENEVIEAGVRNLAATFFIVYTILLSLSGSKRTGNIIALLLLLVVSVELILFSNITVNERPVITRAELKQKTGYNDYTNEAVRSIRSQDKGFYRIDKDFGSGLAIHRSINDAQVQKYYGTPSYYSFNQLNYIKYLEAMEYINGQNETETRWAPGLSGAPFLHPFACVKYSLTRNIHTVLRDFNYDSLTTVGDIMILKNRNTLPLGFTYDKMITLNDFRKISPNNKAIVLYKAFVVDDSLYRNITGFEKFQLKDTAVNYTWTENSNDIAALKTDSLVMESFSQNQIRGRIKTEKQKLLFFSIPFDKGWKVKIDNKEVEPVMVNVGFTGVIVDKGDHQVELTFTPRLYRQGAFVSGLGIILFILLIGFKKMIDQKRISLWKKKDNPEFIS